jgi:TetR/AcrR family transcriptional regulator, transcriptional repressor for nem operon
MRYPKTHKEQVRQALLSNSGSHAKKHGFAATGVDALAATAGLTTGSLYKHFDNKDALFSAVIEAEIDRTVSRFSELKPGDEKAIHKALASYLSMQHVRSPEDGCPLPALTADVARASDEVRETFEAGVLNLKTVLEKITGSDFTAWTLIAQCVGAVMIARAMRNDAEKRAVVEGVRKTAAALLTDSIENK